MDTKTDVVVVGGGIAGLVAAAWCATGGRRVVLAESRPTLGGRAATTDKDGYQLNEGPHALYRAGAFRAVLDELGVAYHGLPPVLDGAMGRLGDTLHPFPVGPAAVARTGLLTVGGKVDFARLATAIRKGTAPVDPYQDVDSWLAGLTDREDVARLFTALFRLGTYANAPGLLSAAAAARQFQLSARGGVLYIDGGWRTLCRGLAAVAAAHGADLRPGAAVHGLEVTPGGWSVQAGDDVVRAPSVVLATGPETARRLLDLDAAAFADAGPPITASVLDVGFAGLPVHRFVHGVDRPFYLSTHTPPAQLAPTGRTLMTALWYHAPGDEPSPAAGRAELAAHVAHAGLPGPEPELRRYLHRMVVANGMPLARCGGEAGRPPVIVPERPGALLAGDWVGGEGLLSDAAAASGREAARQVLAAAGATPALSTAPR